MIPMAKKNYKSRGKGSQRVKSDANSKEFQNSSSKQTSSNSAQSYVGRENDPRWYTHNQRLIEDVTKIPFNSQIGRPIAYSSDTYNVPAIMALDVMTGPGIANSNMDGVNIAGQALFQKMRKDLSTYAPYAQADVTMCILAITEIFTQYATIARFFGLANLYSSVNLAYSDTLLTAAGLVSTSIPDFRANFNDYRAQFNNLIYKAQSLYFPAAFPIVERYLWQFSNYFYDHNDPRAQIYIYRPANYWQLVETSENGTTLEFKDLYVTHGVDRSIGGYLARFNAAIEAIRGSDSMLKIMADLRNAFKDVQPWKLSFLDESYVVLPVHSTEVLSQIENAIILPGIPSVDVNITQNINSNTVVWRPGYPESHIRRYIPATSASGDASVRFARLMQNPIVNMHWVNPTSDDIIVATRLMPTVVVDDENVVRIESMGSDLIVQAQIFTPNAISGTLELTSVFEYNVFIVPEWGTDPAPDVLAKLSQHDFMQYIAFDWAPRLNCIELTTSADGQLVTSLSGMSPVVEIDNYTSVSTNLLARIHNNVILSMWNVPELGMNYN